MPTLSTRRRSPVASPAPFQPLPDGGPAKAQLDRILRSRTFSRAHRSQHFLRYILLHAEAHPGEQLKEYSIAVDVFHRDSSYDPSLNNTVRVEAGRLRSRLLEYYAGDGHADPLVFEIPKGSYRVRIQQRDPTPAPAEIPPPSPPANPLGLSAPRPLTPRWAVPLAFLIGAFVGYRASH
jgi:hypothetical protein